MLKKILLMSILLFSFLLVQSCIDTENWTGNNLGSRQKQPTSEVARKDYKEKSDKENENKEFSENTQQYVKK